MEAIALQTTRIYRKTAQGLAEIETRALKLAPRPRAVLVMVDGRRTHGELRRQLGERCDESIEQLLREGFIEGVAEGTPTPARVAVVDVPLALTPLAGPPPEPAPQPLLSDLPAIRRAAVRQLLDQVGPMGEGLAMKIEAARQWAELKPLLVIGQQMLANVRGAASADEWRQRFLPN